MEVGHASLFLCSFSNMLASGIKHARQTPVSTQESALSRVSEATESLAVTTQPLQDETLPARLA